MAEQLIEVEYTHAHLFGGVGGGAMGLNAATVRFDLSEGYAPHPSVAMSVAV